MIWLRTPEHPGSSRTCSHWNDDEDIVSQTTGLWWVKIYLRSVVGGRAGLGTVTKKIRLNNRSGVLCEMTAFLHVETEHVLPKSS